MLSLAVTWLFAALALLLADRLFQGVQLKGDFISALLVTFVFGVLNMTLGMLLVGFLGLATLGIGFLFVALTRLVAAAICLKMASGMSRRFNIDGFGSALGTAFLLALAGELAERLIH